MTSSIRKVFAKQPKTTLAPEPAEVDGFNEFMKAHQGGWLLRELQLIILRIDR